MVNRIKSLNWSKLPLVLLLLGLFVAPLVGQVTISNSGGYVIDNGGVGTWQVSSTGQMLYDNANDAQALIVRRNGNDSVILKTDGSGGEIYLQTGAGANELFISAHNNRMQFEGASSFTFDHTNATGAWIFDANGEVIRLENAQIGFFAATPVAQPTTASSEAAFVENAGGTAVNVDSTFGGYTLQQIAQALQDLGLLQ